jgi:hypothetical protein
VPREYRHQPKWYEIHINSLNREQRAAWQTFIEAKRALSNSLQSLARPGYKILFAEKYYKHLSLAQARNETTSAAAVSVSEFMQLHSGQVAPADPDPAEPDPVAPAETDNARAPDPNSRQLRADEVRRAPPNHPRRRTRDEMRADARACLDAFTDELTDRQRHILAARSEGAGFQAIADELGIGMETVSDIERRLLTKLWRQRARAANEETN